MSITTEYRAIMPGVPVLLNLGFSQSRYRKLTRFQPYPALCRIYVEYLSQVLEPGWQALVSHGCAETETTMIVKGVFKEDARHSDLLWNMVTMAYQDCIAIYYPDEDIGFLFGSEAAAWGKFDINLFLKGEWDE